MAYRAKTISSTNDFVTQGKRPRLQLRGLEPAEHEIQGRVCRVLAIEIAAPGRLSAGGVTWFAIDHAHYAGIPALRVGRGIISGIPDLFLLHAGLTHFVELKRPERPDEATHPRLSEAQQWLLPVLAAAGSRIGVARSEWEVLALLDAWQIPRRGLIPKDAA